MEGKEKKVAMVNDNEMPGPIETVFEEVVDIIEGSYAESREEVFDHIVDVVDRNKAVFGVAAGTLLVKNVFLNPKSAQKLAKDVSFDMRAVEAAKWGRRAI